MTTYRISHKNINSPVFSTAEKVDWFLFDSNLNCNLHCIYCHNNRDLGLVKEEDFENFLNTKILSIDHFSLGCAMEPTMDKRMAKFASILHNSKVKPTGVFRIQTNGILLDRHDVLSLKSSGVNRFNISLDTIDADIHRQLRGGSDIDKILSNIKNLKAKWSEVEVEFVTTISKLNASSIEDLLKYGIDNGIYQVVLRKMFYEPNSNIIENHDTMAKILMTNEEFTLLCKPLMEKYGKQIRIYFNDETSIQKFHNTVKV